jgi:hypothetical protein
LDRLLSFPTTLPGIIYLCFWLSVIERRTVEFRSRMLGMILSGNTLIALNF